jgi:hypothetical protein
MDEPFLVVRSLDLRLKPALTLSQNEWMKRLRQSLYLSTYPRK